MADLVKDVRLDPMYMQQPSPEPIYSQIPNLSLRASPVDLYQSLAHTNPQKRKIVDEILTQGKGD